MNTQPPRPAACPPQPRNRSLRPSREAVIAFSLGGMVGGLWLAETGWPVSGWTVSIAAWAVFLAATLGALR